MIYSLFIIPILGCMKNYAKYKRVSPLLFLRTPFIYTFLYLFLTLFNFQNRICQTIINERIIMFLYKIIMALLTDNYYKKRLKYEKKYGINYNNDDNII